MAEGEGRRNSTEYSWTVKSAKLRECLSNFQVPRHDDHAESEVVERTKKARIELQEQYQPDPVGT